MMKKPKPFAKGMAGNAVKSPKKGFEIPKIPAPKKTKKF
jgi:hypothetical protein